MYKIIFFTFSLLLTTSLFADHSRQNHFFLAENKAGGIEILEPWAACSKTRNGSIYMKIKSPVDDRLIKAEARHAAKKVEIHTHAVDSNGVAHMKEVPFLTCPSSTPAELKPMGDHIMLLGLTRNLEVGQQINLILHFEKAGKVHVTVPVMKREKKCSSCKA